MENKACMAKTNIIKHLTSRILTLASEEINKPETQTLLKQRIITPVIYMIYKELYPYIIALTITIAIILLLSILTFIAFIVYYLKN